MSTGDKNEHIHDRAHRREVVRKRKKIEKRGPMVWDFCGAVDTKTGEEMITFKELKKLLPKPLYKAIKDYTQEEGCPVGILRTKDGEDGIGKGDCYVMFENAKRWAREQVIHKQ